MGVPVEHGVASVDRFAERFCDLLRRAPDPEQPVVGLSWTVRQLGAHLASGAMAYGDITDGRASPYESLDERAATNQERLEKELSNDLGAMCDAIEREVDSMLGSLRQRPDHEMIAWHGGLVMPAGAFLGAMVGEFAFHGLDLARTLHEQWPISRHDALPIIDFFGAVIPHVVNLETARGVRAVIEMRYRGYESSTFAFDRGALTVIPGRATRSDVHLSIDPVAFALIAYKRSGLARLVLNGKAVAWGRRPWLAFSLPSYFQAP